MNALNVIAAKSDRDDHTKWLSFLTHSKDTAGIMQKLYQKWLPQQVRNNLSRSISAQTSLQTAEMHTGKLCRLIAFLHDIGKVTPAFQLRITDSIENHREMMRCAGLELGHIKEPNKSPHPLAGQAILEDFGFPREITSIVGAHHGKGDVYKSLDQICTYPSNYYGEKRRQKSEWRSLWKEWIDYTLSETGFSIDTLPHPDIKSQMILTGILIMADWIASNTYYFPYLEVGEIPDEEGSRQRVNRAWVRLGLPYAIEIEDCCDSPRAFAERFGFEPKSVQKRIIDIISQNPSPGLYILEAPMGVGKTEAAMAAAEVFIKQCGAGGIYFGLPTQATANGIFGRIRDWAESCDAETHSIRLAHGMTELNEEYQAIFRGTANDSDDYHVIVHEWFEGKKQAMLSDFVIATVDQFLLASLKQRHVMLRHLGLAGKVVIIDECHAYDAYMNVYLDRTLTWMGAYGVPVIVLSATLPPKRREELLNSYSNSSCAKEYFSGDNRFAYPVLTYTRLGDIKQEKLECDIPEKRIHVVKLEEDKLSEYLSERLCEGGRAAVILNSVAYAQSIAELLRSKMNLL